MKIQIQSCIYRICALIVLCAFFALASCEKGDNSSNPNNNSNNSNNNNSNGLPNCNNGYLIAKYGDWEFFYDNQGKLIKLVDRESNGEDFISYYEYSVDNKPNKIKIMKLKAGREVQIREETITYSAARHPLRLVDFTFDDSTFVYHSFTTDGQGRIVTDSLSNPYYSVGKYTMKWSGENLSEYIYSLMTSKTTYEFDNKPNPLYGLRYCFLDNPISAFFWSKNNPIKGTFKAGSIEQILDLNVRYYENELISANISNNYYYRCK